MTSGSLLVRACLLQLGLFTGPLSGQDSTSAPAGDAGALDSGPQAEATAVLEKTLFRIDVARLHLRLGREATDALAPLLSTRPLSREARDSLAGIAIRSRDAWAELTFRWGIGFPRFMEELRRGADVAKEAGWIAADFADALSTSFPAWYAPLRERGVRDGDVMTYRIRGDTLRTVFRTVEGEILVDQVDVGTQPPRAVLGGFLGRGSEFREGLLESLEVKPGIPGAPGTPRPGVHTVSTPSPSAVLPG